MCVVRKKPGNTSEHHRATDDKGARVERPEARKWLPNRGWEGAPTSTPLAHKEHSSIATQVKSAVAHTRASQHGANKKTPGGRQRETVQLYFVRSVP